MKFYVALCLAAISHATLAKSAPREFDPEEIDCDTIVPACSRELDPVCNEDGDIFGNLCALQIAHCQSEDVSGKLAPCPAGLIRAMYSANRRDASSAVSYIGGHFNEFGFWEWDDSLPVFSSEVDDVPTINGKKKTTKKTKKEDEPEDEEDTEDSSCDFDDVCYKVFLPVCDDEGNVYANDCVFEHAQCEDPSIKLGQCDASR
jgi:hypothetical protein